MTEFIFMVLESLGFHHPVHPALTHIPMGMIIGAFLFALAGMLLDDGRFWQTAQHCIALALLTIVPTAIAGYMDWQHSFDGEWETLIGIKIALAFFLTFLLSLTYHFARSDDQKKFFICLIICVLSAVGLGYSGGELLYG